MTMDSRTLAMLAPLLLLLIGLGFTVWVDPYIGRERRRVMLLIVLLSLSLIVQNVLEYRCAVTQPGVPWRTVLTIYGYAVRLVILILFLYIGRPSSLPSASGSTSIIFFTAAPWARPASCAA